jgi:glycosyltransferase involved in cell wall biosynthesis
VSSVYLESVLAVDLGMRLSRGESFQEAIRGIIGTGRFRTVHFAPLDVYYHHSLRVVQVVTSLQQGGAERVTLSLFQELGKFGVRALLATLGCPTRKAFPLPDGAIDLTRDRSKRLNRLQALRQTVLSFGADLVHGHLLSQDDISAMATFGVPLVFTIHNVRAGWPAGLGGLGERDAALLIACARAVEAELRSAGLPIPLRTIWNGIDLAPFECTHRLPTSMAPQKLGIGRDDFVLLAVANPRPQKRLHLLPGILAATRDELIRRGVDRQARLLIAGQASATSEPALLAEKAIHDEAGRLGLEASIELLGSVEEIAPILAAADALLSVSAFEGLSLAQLEALTAGIPVVATDVGGTCELAHGNPAVFLLPVDASAGSFAQVLADIAQSRPPSGRSQAAIHFTSARMAERHAQLYPRAIVASSRSSPGRGLFLITNNFSTGGAQSSARRLLLGLASAGVAVHAAVLEEQPNYPTPGHQALIAVGIPVVALPPVGTIDAALAIARLLETMDAATPAAVLLWNVIAEYKLLLADHLLDVPVFDVSPGEMYYSSLERYFTRPRPGLPYRTPAEYGARLAGVIVKYHAEAAQAAEILQTKVHVIPNGVPLADPPNRVRKPNEKLVIGTVARLSPQKRLEDLLLALKHAREDLPPHVLRIAGGPERGDSTYADKLRELADGDSVEWLGEVNDSQLFLQELDVFAMISEPAGCPNASLEAMAQGLPVIATDVGGAAEQVEDGVTGRLVPQQDPAAFAAALVELARHPDQRRNWGEAGRARVADRFTLQRMIADYRRVCLGDTIGRR